MRPGTAGRVIGLRGDQQTRIALDPDRHPVHQHDGGDRGSFGFGRRHFLGKRVEFDPGTALQQAALLQEFQDRLAQPLLELVARDGLGRADRYRAEMRRGNRTPGNVLPCQCLAGWFARVVNDQDLAGKIVAVLGKHRSRVNREQAHHHARNNAPG